MNYQTMLMENVSMDGFQVVSSKLFSNEKPPAMTIFRNEISFSREAHGYLNYCVAIQIMINSKEKKVMIKAAPSTDENSICWKEKLKESYIPRFNCPKLTKPLFSMWGWDTDYRYRTEGRLVKCDKKPILLFDFNEAKAYLGKEMPKKND